MVILHLQIANRFFLAQNPYDLNDLPLNVIENTEVANPKSKLCGCGLSKKLNSGLALQSRVHHQNLFYLVQDSRVIKSSQLLQVLNCFIRVFYLIRHESVTLRADKTLSPNQKFPAAISPLPTCALWSRAGPRRFRLWRP